ncbi:M23 family metallopeptidase [Streptomyces sclerotialus]|uniref:M23 family metallopeptidase n=1 Tax=Streptomyces sclerotialus TaxID=1957 RepID=UPI000D142D44
MRQSPHPSSPTIRPGPWLRPGPWSCPSPWSCFPPWFRLHRRFRLQRWSRLHRWSRLRLRHAFGPAGCAIGCVVGYVLLIGPLPFTPPPSSLAAAPATGFTAARAIPAASAARIPTPREGRSSLQELDRDSPSGTVAKRAWPVSHATGARPVVIRPWVPPPTPWAAGHRGVDLASRAGATVRAAAPGRVSFAGNVAGRGVLSIALSGTGRPPLRTTYEPVRPTVRKGDRVRAGQPVAVLQPGPYHCDTPCLHWGLRRGRTYLDPLSLLPPSLLAQGPTRLLPLLDIPEPALRPRPLSFTPTSSASNTDTTETTLAAATALTAIAAWAHARLRRRGIVKRDTERPGAEAGRGGRQGGEGGREGRRDRPVSNAQAQRTTLGAEHGRGRMESKR